MIKDNINLSLKNFSVKLDISNIRLLENYTFDDIKLMNDLKIMDNRYNKHTKISHFNPNKFTIDSFRLTWKLDQYRTLTVKINDYPMFYVDYVILNGFMVIEESFYASDAGLYLSGASRKEFYKYFKELNNNDDCDIFTNFPIYNEKTKDIAKYPHIPEENIIKLYSKYMDQLLESNKYDENDRLSYCANMSIKISNLLNELECSAEDIDWCAFKYHANEN